MRLYKLLTFIVLASLVLSSCGTGASEEENQNTVNTVVAKTLGAITTQLAESQESTPVPPTDSPESTPPTPTATFTPLPTATPTTTPTKLQGTCDYATFIADITIPDGTMIPPATRFKKTWAIKNIGTCVWTTGYNLVYYGGSLMEAPERVPLSTKPVLPGETVHVSVDLTTPADAKLLKKYFSNWKLMNENGQVFGVVDYLGEERSLYAEVVVGLVYNFAYNVCAATWKSSSGPITCPGVMNDPRGFVYLNTAPQIEGGIIENDPAIALTPPQVKDGWIVGQYPPIIIPEWSNLDTYVGCLGDPDGQSTCDVTFKISYSVDGGPEQVLFTRSHSYGEWFHVSKQLFAYGMVGKSVSFLFYVYANNDGKENNAFFFFPIMTP
ncbi:MAG: NBR1-Ig-like domain-containing protein [Anaerolineaceae bacterium]